MFLVHLKKATAKIETIAKVQKSYLQGDYSNLKDSEVMVACVAALKAKNETLFEILTEMDLPFPAIEIREPSEAA